jgi:hypothetical protein
MLHRVVNSAPQPLVAVVHLLLRQPVQRLLDVQVVHVVIQVIVAQTFTTDTIEKRISAQKSLQTKELQNTDKTSAPKCNKRREELGFRQRQTVFLKLLGDGRLVAARRPVPHGLERLGDGLLGSHGDAERQTAEDRREAGSEAEIGLCDGGGVFAGLLFLAPLPFRCQLRFRPRSLGHR